MVVSYTCFIVDCGMGSGVNFFLAIIFPFLRMMKFQLTWKFAVVPRYMDPCDLSAMVLVGIVSSYISTYVPNSTLQCLD